MTALLNLDNVICIEFCSSSALDDRMGGHCPKHYARSHFWALTLLSLHEDGTHKDAKSTTVPLAQLEYDIHLAALCEIHILSRGWFNGNKDQARLEVKRWFIKK